MPESKEHTKASLNPLGSFHIFLCAFASFPISYALKHFKKGSEFSLLYLDLRLNLFFILAFPE